eukprot:Pgem_evm1s14096
MIYDLSNTVSNPENWELSAGNAVKIAGLTHVGIESFTIVLQLRGGENSRIELAEVIFKDEKSTYPI